MRPWVIENYKISAMILRLTTVISVITACFMFISNYYYARGPGDYSDFSPFGYAYTTFALASWYFCSSLILIGLSHHQKDMEKLYDGRIAKGKLYKHIYYILVSTTSLISISVLYMFTPSIGNNDEYTNTLESSTVKISKDISAGENPYKIDNLSNSLAYGQMEFSIYRTVVNGDESYFCLEGFHKADSSDFRHIIFQDKKPSLISDTKIEIGKCPLQSLMGDSYTVP